MLGLGVGLRIGWMDGCNSIKLALGWLEGWWKGGQERGGGGGSVYIS